MKFLHKPLFRMLCLWAGLAAMPGPACAADLLPPALRALAAGAQSPVNWPRLRSFAQSQDEPEWSGWAYFLAGYQEYAARRFAEAAQDLNRAAQSGFSLANFAVYYQASALQQENQPQEAAVVLQDFAARFPRSPLHEKALAERASAFLDAQEGQEAIDAVLADPQARAQPALSLLLGKACMQAHQLIQAARAFQDVYYNFPASPQAKPASEALSTLQEQLGLDYPVPDGEHVMTRVDALIKAGRYADAFQDYTGLLHDEPSSPMVPRWEMGQAMCLVHLHRTADALKALAAHLDSRELEGQRLALLVQVHAQQTDALAITQDLAQLETTYNSSSAYADALSAAGIFYYRQLNWQEAARNYRRLQELFPKSDHLREDGWRLAWCDYLLGDPQTIQVMHGYLMQFPDSPRAPAALYWLARMEEDHDALAEAQALYALLLKRYVHTYYAPQASARMAAIRARQVGLANSGNSADAPLAAALMPVLSPPAMPRRLACVPIAPSDATRPALILQALNLQDVEEEFLKAALAEDNPPPELRLLLAEVYDAQDNASSALFAALKTVPGYAQMDFSDLPEEVWNFLYPQAYRKLIETQARQNHLDPYLVMGLIRQESAFSARALSNANARGLMQLLPQTAAHSNRASRTRRVTGRLYDPNYNVQAGCAYLAGLLKDFDGRVELALAAYNAGDFRVRDWEKKYSFRDTATFLESIPIPATRAYVELVLRDAEVYRQLMNGSPHFAVCTAAEPPAPRNPGGR